MDTAHVHSYGKERCLRPLSPDHRTTSTSRLLMQRAQSLLWVDNHFTGWASEKNLEAVENIPPENAFAAGKVRLQAAGLLLPVELNPDQKAEGCRGTTRNPTDL